MFGPLTIWTLTFRPWRNRWSWGRAGGAQCTPWRLETRLSIPGAGPPPRCARPCKKHASGFRPTRLRIRAPLFRSTLWLCDISDYLAVNCHPYFSGIEALTSGTWLQQQTAQLKSHCNNGKDILITESGWPNAGNTLGQAVPSTESQVLALQSLGKVMGHQVVMFTMYNDYWKDPGPYNVEQRWGIYGDPSA